MNFGDWELFRMLVLGLREREADEDLYSKNVRFADTHSTEEETHRGQGLGEDTADETSMPPSSLASSSTEGSLMRRGNVTKITLW